MGHGVCTRVPFVRGAGACGARRRRRVTTAGAELVALEIVRSAGAARAGEKPRQRNRRAGHLAAMQIQLRILQAHAALTTPIMAMLAYGSFTQEPKRAVFDVIDAQRINIVEPDGKQRLVLSNTRHFPDPVVRGVTLPFRKGGKSPGMIFYNDVGDECGGLIIHGSDKGAGAAFLFDQYRQDQTIGLTYADTAQSGGKRSRMAGLQVWDRPEDFDLVELVEELESVDRTDPRAMADMESRLRGEGKLVGRARNGDVGLFLSDALGNTRVRLTVPARGEPRMEFLDAEGRRVKAFPE